MTDQHFGKSPTSIKHATHSSSTPPFLKPKKSTKFNSASNSKPKIEIFGTVTRDRTMHFNRSSFLILFFDRERFSSDMSTSFVLRNCFLLQAFFFEFFFESCSHVFKIQFKYCVKIYALFCVRNFKQLIII